MSGFHSFLNSLASWATSIGMIMIVWNVGSFFFWCFRLERHPKKMRNIGRALAAGIVVFVFGMILGNVNSWLS